ncbi:MAG: DUF4230 domain-containing protein [Bergeyella sp.]|nr:DUF4230 domain-containing protein [Bergeyella sp.]
MRNLSLGIFVGFLLGSFLGVGTYKFFSKKEDRVKNDYYILSNQIKKMNKMVVVEHDFSSIQKTKITSELLGISVLPSVNKQIITHTKTQAQVSYDLNKMKIEIDSVQKKLIIRSLPAPELKLVPSVEIQSMDDYFFHRFDENDIKKITAAAKEQALKSVNPKSLLAEGKKQLLKNLEQIFVLSKVLHYTIEDRTQTLDTSLL